MTEQNKYLGIWVNRLIATSGVHSQKRLIQFQDTSVKCFYHQEEKPNPTYKVKMNSPSGETCTALP